jgi:hypothetical protein
VSVWYISPCFGIFSKEKSGNPGKIVLLVKFDGALFEKSASGTSLSTILFRLPLVHAGLPDGTYILIPKIPFCAYFGGPLIGRCWYLLWSYGIFMYGNLVCLIIKIWQPCSYAIIDPMLHSSNAWADAAIIKI